MNRKPMSRAISTIVALLTCLSLGCGAADVLAPKPTRSNSLETAVPPQATTAVPDTPAAPSPTPPPAPVEQPGASGAPGALASFERVNPALDPAADIIRDVRAAPNGAMWLDTDQGLWVLQEGAWTRRGSEANTILGFDGEGRAWTMDEGGEQVTVWSGEAWRAMGSEAGWATPGRIVRAVPYATVGETLVTDRRGWIWLVTSQDVRAFDGERWRTFTPEEAGFAPSADMVEMGFGFSLSDVALDSTGDIWVTDCAWGGPGPMGQGARWFDGSTWQGQASPVVGSGCIEDVEVDEVGRIWVGIDDRLWRYAQGQGWQELPHPDLALQEGLRWGWIADLTLGGEDTIWVTMSPCGGASCDTGLFLLFRVRGGAWSLISDEGIADLALDSSGSGWLCVGQKLYEVSNGEPTLAHEDDVFTCRLEADTTGRTWLWQPGSAELWVYAGK